VSLENPTPNCSDVKRPLQYKTVTMPREVDLNLQSLLEKRAPGTTKVELADRLGISEGTLRGYFENRWTVLDRTVVERLADFFQCDVASLLTTTESRFFDPFRAIKEKHPARPTCLYLRRPDADTPRIGSGRPVAHRDNQAIGRVGRLLQQCIDDIVGIEDQAMTPDQFDQRLLSNCIVLGSPMVNPASEMAICRIFGAEPFNPRQSTKLPFAFRVAATTLGPSSIVEISRDGKTGIWLREEQELLQADFWPRDKFRELRINKGRDCAVVVACNHPSPDKPPEFRKLVVLSGFGGIGTESAADALADHYRDLEPRHGASFVWGAIEVLYKKPFNSTDREILNYNWRCRNGGRCPLDFAKRKP
jgi:hypothetical protein